MFQSLGRDSVCSYSCSQAGHGILLVLFQSLGRDSVCSYADWLVTPELLERFQSLGRDSVCSYVGKATLDDRLVVFQSLGRDSVCSYWRRCRGMCRRIAVSIPRSGFCLFIRDVQAEDDWGVSSFNPSVGILFVHTRGNRSPPPAGRPFQSLGRDSVCSYLHGRGPRKSHHHVSIPRSGFCLFILRASELRKMSQSGFNPSVGILFVHTIPPHLQCSMIRLFQSLGRDSVCSY